MKFIPIGEFVIIDDETYKCISESIFDATGCDLCDLENTANCNLGLCAPDIRADGVSVQFILYDSEESDEFDLTGEFND